ncbi:MAG: M56 family metallopeptidase [Saprospiraceae bacterium]|nr:ankyrin repeat domain-containing protein [Lewinella sp.]
MNSFNWSELLSFGQATGWTLVHSLWQIALIGLLVRALLFFVPQRQSQTRYLILTAGLMCCLVWTAQTFVREWQSAGTYQAIVQNLADAADKGITDPSANVVPVETSDPTVAATASLPWWETAVNKLQSWSLQLSPYMPALAVVWYLGVLILTGFLLLGFLQMDRLRSRDVQHPDHSWRVRFRELCREMGIHRKVNFLLSNSVQEPITFYFFRPVVLAPVSLFTGLHPEQLEILLLHELAHIRRADFLVNIVQSIVEVLFFYHPVVWWISGKTREEREHCCDDLVIQVRDTPMLYAEALTHLQLFHHPSKTRLVMNANGNSGTFSKRIFRLFGQYDQQPSLIKGALFVLIISISFLVQAFIHPTTSVSTEITQHQPNEIADETAAVIPDPIPNEASITTLLAIFEGDTLPSGKFPDYVHTFMVRTPVTQELSLRIGSSQDLKEVVLGLAADDQGCQYFISWESLTKGTHQLTWDLRHIPSGTYELISSVDGESMQETITIDHEAAPQTYPPGDPRADHGCSDLLRAVKAGDAAQVSELLKTVDPNCNFRDDGEPRSPLVAAARLGHLEIGQLLVAAQADVEFHDRGDETPLMAAARYGHLDFVKYLLDQKAEVNAQVDGDGTALICAVSGNYYEIAKLLLEHGADPYQVSPGDEYAMYHARMAGNKKMVELLKGYEGRR